MTHVVVLHDYQQDAAECDPWDEIEGDAVEDVAAWRAGRPARVISP